MQKTINATTKQKIQLQTKNKVEGQSAIIIGFLQSEYNLNDVTVRSYAYDNRYCS